MFINIVLPSINRLKKLSNCIDSIIKTKKHHKIKIYVYFSLVEELIKFKELYNNNIIESRIVTNYRVPEFWNSHLQTMDVDAMMYINDDIVFLDNTLEVIFDNYKDLDSVMGINQYNIDNKNKLDCAFGIIGSKYADRFPNRQVWCPDYYRFFSDRELGDYAKSINKFKFCEEAKIIHFHPGFGGIVDKTHNEVRRFLKQDETIYYKRQTLRWLWGRDFNLLESK